jgi:SAM-dependent methyltransferase
MAMYGKMEYWDERYRHSDSYDWLQNYNSLRRLLTVEALMATTKLNCMLPFPSHEKCRVLILGCGNSTFGHDMLADGWQGRITNVDFSSVVIDQMKKKHQKHSESIDFVCADITKGLPFEDKSFDLIICKGTFDAILTSAGSISHAKVVVSECSRVLANGHGVLFLVSHGNSDSRVVFLERDNDLSYYWQEVSVHTVARRSNHNAK